MIAKDEIRVVVTRIARHYAAMRGRGFTKDQIRLVEEDLEIGAVFDDYHRAIAIEAKAAHGGHFSFGAVHARVSDVVSDRRSREAAEKRFQAELAAGKTNGAYEGEKLLTFIDGALCSAQSFGDMIKVAKTKIKEAVDKNLVRLEDAETLWDVHVEGFGEGMAPMERSLRAWKLIRSR